jgi:hypothetical protein
MPFLQSILRKILTEELDIILPFDQKVTKRSNAYCITFKCVRKLCQRKWLCNSTVSLTWWWSRVRCLGPRNEGGVCGLGIAETAPPLPVHHKKCKRHSLPTPGWEFLYNDIQAGEGNVINLFLQYKSRGTPWENLLYRFQTQA